jgi:uncharacterized protein (DUF2267 family)/pterin-4a-carbinolamine dehydratase
VSDKEMEGDNKRRRALARQARERGRLPSEEGVTLGASKQPEHVGRGRRDGPPAAGRHKPDPGTGTAPPPPPPAGRERPRRSTATEADPGPIRYRDLVSAVGHRAGLDFDDARLATEATVTVLARALSDADRHHLLDALPAALLDEFAIEVPDHPDDLVRFLDAVSRIAHVPPERARYQAQAVLSTLAEYDGRLIGSLALPADLRTLTEALPVGGGLLDPAGHPAPLTEDELRTALTRLPGWTGGTAVLSRSLTLPPDRLDRVLERIERLRREWGRGPKISRPAPDTAVLAVRTDATGAVTALDVELAHRLDAALDQAAAALS